MKEDYNMDTGKKTGFIGLGNMAAAMIGGMLERDWRSQMK